MVEMNVLTLPVITSMAAIWITKIIVNSHHHHYQP